MTFNTCIAVCMEWKSILLILYVYSFFDFLKTLNLMDAKIDPITKTLNIMDANFSGFTV